MRKSDTCFLGHPMDYVSPKGERQCRICKNRRAVYYLRNPQWERLDSCPLCPAQRGERCTNICKGPYHGLPRMKPHPKRKTIPELKWKMYNG